MKKNEIRADEKEAIIMLDLPHIIVVKHAKYGENIIAAFYNRSDAELFNKKIIKKLSGEEYEIRHITPETPPADVPPVTVV